MGADPNVQDNAEWSPLHEACNRGNLSVVKVLKEFGADLNLMGFGRGNFTRYFLFQNAAQYLYAQ